MEQELTTQNEVHVACDTGLFWNILHKKAPWLQDFEAMAKDGVVFSLADHALAEILNQLEQGDFTETDFVQTISECARFISPVVPIVPGKKQLANWCTKDPDLDWMERDRRYRVAIWQMLQSAHSLADLEKGVVFCLPDGSQRQIPLKRGDAGRALEEERQKWRDYLNSPRPGWTTRPLQERLEELAGDVDDEVECDPPLVIRLDAALRHEDEIIRLRNDANNPLNPDSEKRRNDGIDYNMSYVFMKRILLCSQERRYPRLIKSLGSFQSDWIFRPEELVETWKQGKLTAPIWPKSSNP